MSITLTVTTAGRAAIVNATNTGTAPVTIAQCGVSATDFAESAATGALMGEIKRIATLSGDVVADDTIHLIVRDESADAFSVRSLALYLADGTLFAVYSQPVPILTKTAASMMMLAIDVKFADIDAAALTFGDANWLNLPATETVQGVAELATQGETDAGLDDTRIVTPKKLRTALLAWLANWFSDVWRSSNDGAGSGLDADLLDGQQGAYYLAAATYTAADIRAKLVTVDGAGSGVDADTVDGFHGNDFLRRAVDFWHTSSDNVRRFFFVTGGQSYFGSAAGWTFQRLDVDRAWIDGYGNLNLEGMLQRISGDSAITVYKSGNNVVWHSDGGCYYHFDRIAKTHNWSTANTLRAWVTQDGYVNAQIGLRAAGNPVWHSGNDGAGSGLDADLFDGLDSLAFVRSGNERPSFADVIIGRASASNDSFGGLELRESGAVGASQSADSYAPGLNLHWLGRTAARIFMNAAGQFVFAGQGNIAANRRDVLAADFYSNGHLVMSRGNDGSGSGFDADTVDGYHAGAFALASQFSKGENAQGRWRISPDGFVEQWGIKNGPWNAQVVVNVTFPLPYDTAPAAADIIVSGAINAVSGIQDMYPQVITGSITALGFQVQLQTPGGTQLLDAFAWRCLHDNS